MVQIHEASRAELMVLMIASAAENHGPAVFVASDSAEDLLLADAIIRRGLAVGLATVVGGAQPVRAHLLNTYGLDPSQVFEASTLEEALFGKHSCITSARRQGACEPPKYEYDARLGVIRFNPLATWTDADVAAHLREQRIRLLGRGTWDRGRAEAWSAAA